MRPVHRWGLVALVCLLLVAGAGAGRALPVHDRSISASDLLTLIRSRDGAPYTGSVDVQGNVGLPISDHFTDLGDLLGGDSRLRVWWRSGTDWRVDRLLDTGEVDLFHHGRRTTRWDYEDARATTSRDPEVRLPRDADLLPPVLAQRALTGATPDEVSRIAPRRVAGIAAVGLRLVARDPRTSIRHVDLWADPATGTVLAIEVYGAGRSAALSSSFTSFSSTDPSPATTAFRPAPGIVRSADDPFDFAGWADQFTPLSPPSSLAGLPKSPRTPNGVGLYGSGLTELMALPLQPGYAVDLERQLRDAGAHAVDGHLFLQAGPLTVMLTRTRHPMPFDWLVAGWVTEDTLLRAARDLDHGVTYR